ncbi:MAG: ArsA family ATPase [Myxococcales bacterium]|nr:ArsA family ATPase [Myxococcales bacterium]
MSRVLHDLIENKRVIVCVGAGGVGKTTISAAIGVAAAQQGRKALVLTVDPARRLANALGLAGFESHAQTLTAETFAAQGVSVRAPLSVAMLDVKSTFDRTVVRLAPNEAAADAILNNRFYQQGSSVLTGSQEYMAMARLYEVVTETSYDLIVLDTPPSAHALDFLDAPQRMIDLFGSPAFRLLLGTMKKRKEGAGMFNKSSLVMRGLGRFTSTESFTGLLEFFGLLSATFDGFIRTAEDVMSLLRSPRTAFLLVSACDEASTQEGQYLNARLVDEQMEVGAWVLNRVQSFAAVDDEAALADEISAIVRRENLDIAVPETTSAMVQVAAALAGIAEGDHVHLANLRDRLGDSQTVVPVPRSRQEPTRLSELAALAQILTHQLAD